MNLLLPLSLSLSLFPKHFDFCQRKVDIQWRAIHTYLKTALYVLDFLRFLYSLRLYIDCQLHVILCTVLRQKLNLQIKTFSSWSFSDRQSYKCIKRNSKSRAHYSEAFLSSLLVCIGFPVYLSFYAFIRSQSCAHNKGEAWKVCFPLSRLHVFHPRLVCFQRFFWFKNFFSSFHRSSPPLKPFFNRIPLTYEMLSSSSFVFLLSHCVDVFKFNLFS